MERHHPSHIYFLFWTEKSFSVCLKVEVRNEILLKNGSAVAAPFGDVSRFFDVCLINETYINYTRWIISRWSAPRGRIIKGCS